MKNLKKYIVYPGLILAAMLATGAWIYAMIAYQQQCTCDQVSCYHSHAQNLCCVVAALLWSLPFMVYANEHPERFDNDQGANGSSIDSAQSTSDETGM